LVWVDDPCIEFEAADSFDDLGRLQTRLELHMHQRMLGTEPVYHQGGGV
jgi:hypothetical protein